MFGHETGERSDLRKHSDLVDLCHYGIKHFSLEWTKHNCLQNIERGALISGVLMEGLRGGGENECDLVFDWVETEPSAWLQRAQSDVVYCSHCYHKPMPGERGERERERERYRTLSILGLTFRCKFPRLQ